jgi:hypothetical protein
MNSLPLPRQDQQNDTYTSATTVTTQSQHALENEIQDKLNAGYDLEGVAMDRGHFVAVFSRTIAT